MSDERRQHMEKTLDRMIDMVKFAEAKHAMLITFAGAAIFSVINLRLSLSGATLCLDAYVYAFILLAIAAMVIALVSFAPVTKASLDDDGGDDLENLAYFGHVARHDGVSFLASLRAAMAEHSDGRNDVELFLAGEIVINARIAMRKFTLFRWALFCLISAVLTPVLAGLAWWLVARTGTNS